MDGPALVDLLAAGDPRGLAEAYDAYADRLFSYCVALLHDRDAAADAVHDALLIARDRAGQLRDPERLRPWLYAIARNECLRALRARRRAAALDEAAEMTDDSVDLEAALRADELRELVWSAAAALNPGEREVLELSVRHGLDGADLAAALGVSGKHAAALLSRSRAQLERALSALILARTCRDDCPELDGLLADWDGRLTPLLRKRLVRHLERCSVCGEQRRLRVSATALLAGVPFLVAPTALRRRVLDDAGDLHLVSDWQELAVRAGPFWPDGFPRPLGDRRRRMITWSAAAAVVAVAAVLLVLGLFVLPGPTPAPVAGEALAPGTTALTATGTPTPTPTPTPPLGTTGLAGATATPGRGTAPLDVTTPPVTTVPTTPAPVTTATTAAATTPAATTPPATTQTTMTPLPPLPTPKITVRSAFVSADCRVLRWIAGTYADITGAPVATAVARWYVDPAKPTDVPMTLVQGTLWSATLPELPTNTKIIWLVTVTTVDGVVTRSGTGTLQHDCAPPG